MIHATVKQIRQAFIDALANEEFVIDKTGSKLVELVGTSFIASEPAIFGKPNTEYIEREISWYETMSLYVKDIPGKTPKIWEQVSDRSGKINSNYGFLINSSANGYQYEHALDALIQDPFTRRSIMIYTRPSIQSEYNSNGMSDFICTNTVQYIIRNNKLNAIVNMRSNDVVFGYRNDWAWQKYVLDNMVADYNNLTTKLSKMQNTETPEHITAGDILWQTGSLHVYERHFNLIK